MSAPGANGEVSAIATAQLELARRQHCHGKLKLTSVFRRCCCHSLSYLRPMAFLHPTSMYTYIHAYVHANKSCQCGYIYVLYVCIYIYDLYIQRSPKHVNKPKMSWQTRYFFRLTVSFGGGCPRCEATPCTQKRSHGTESVPRGPKLTT